MTFIDWFAGVGGFRRGMELAGHKCVGFCEFDKYAVASYTSMHLITDKQREQLSKLDLKKRQKEILKEEYRNGEWYGPDVTRVYAGDIPRADCWCFGFPCQDISVAGYQKGFKGNRSSLFFRITGLLRDLKEEDRPHTLFIENVRNLLSVNRGYDFARLLVELDQIGYDAEWEVLNSKDFGVPQNRERCFIIGHLRGSGRREVFPLRRDAEQTDIQEVGVEQIASMGGGKYEVNGSQPYRVYDKDGLAPTLGTAQGGGREPHIQVIGTIANPEAKGTNCRAWVHDIHGQVGALTATEGKQPKQILVPNDSINVVGNTNPSGHGIGGNVYGTENSIAPTVSCNKNEGYKIAVPVLTPDREEKRQNGRRFKEDGEPMFTLTAQDRHGVLIKEATSKGYQEAEEEEDSINLSVPGSKTRRGRVGKGLANTLDTGCQQGVITKYNKNDSQSQKVYSTEGLAPTLMAVSNSGLTKIDTSYRIRKLTPKECFRLQGWTDDYFEKAEFVNSNSQLYKQAGNGVTVSVIYEIGRRL